jgi:hypothetical protein
MAGVELSNGGPGARKPGDCDRLALREPRGDGKTGLSLRFEEPCSGTPFCS